MSTENNLRELISDFSPSPVPYLSPGKESETQRNGIKALTFIDYMDHCRATAGDSTVLAAIPTHLKTDLARNWYRVLVKKETEGYISIMDVIWSLLDKHVNSELNKIWDERYPNGNSDKYFKSSEFAQRSFYIQTIQDLEKEVDKLRKEIEDLKNESSEQTGDGDRPQSSNATPTSTFFGAPSQPHLRPFKLEYSDGATDRNVLIPIHDDMAYNELVPLAKSALEFVDPTLFESRDYNKLRFICTKRGVFITPDVWPLVRAELEVVRVAFI